MRNLSSADRCPAPAGTTPAVGSPRRARDARCRRYALGEQGRHPQGLRRRAGRARRPRPDVVALDGEVSNSTYAEEFAKAYPDRYFEMFIAEQQLVAAAVGLSVRGYIPFASTFAAFFTRAYDFIRMAAISQANIRLVGSHAGVEIGADGPSQMALEDLAMMRAVHGSTVLYPSDATAPPRSSTRWPTRPASSTCARPEARIRCCTAPTRPSRSAARRSLRSERRRRGHADRRRRHVHECLRRRRSPRARRHPRAGHRPVLRQADRHRDTHRRRGRAPAAGSSSPRTTTPRAASARRCRRAARRWRPELRLAHLRSRAARLRHDR